jgi:hypothetical protein
MYRPFLAAPLKIATGPAIAKLVECAPSTLYDWLQLKGIRAKA